MLSQKNQELDSWILLQVSQNWLIAVVGDISGFTSTP
jgi:hypothetical protein